MKNIEINIETREDLNKHSLILGTKPRILHILREMFVGMEKEYAHKMSDKTKLTVTVSLDVLSATYRMNPAQLIYKTKIKEITSLSYVLRHNGDSISVVASKTPRMGGKWGRLAEELLEKGETVFHDSILPPSAKGKPALVKQRFKLLTGLTVNVVFNSVSKVWTVSEGKPSQKIEELEKKILAPISEIEEEEEEEELESLNEEE